MNPLHRIYLHSICLIRGGSTRWHLAGIAREVKLALLIVAALGALPLALAVIIAHVKR